MLTRRTLGSTLIAGTIAAPAMARSVAENLGGSAELAGPWTETVLVQRAGGVLHVASVGEGGAAPPLVVLHKLGGWISDWRDTARLLSHGRRVIAIDLPGHGSSRWEGTPPRVQTVEETAMLVAGALRELGVGQCDLAGTSLGGCVAVALAALRPAMVRRLALPSCVLGPALTEAQLAERQAAQASMYTADGLPRPTPAALSQATFGLIDAERISDEQNASRARAGLWIRPHESGVALTDFLPLMARVPAPTLLVYGDRDTFFLRYREGAEATLPQSTTVILPGASGFLVQDNPQATAQTIASFLDAG